MNKRLLLATSALSIALSLPALAVELPTPGRHDQRIRYVNYDAGNVVELWTTPGAVMVIQFADDETVADVASSDSHNLKAEPRGNILFFKMAGCLIPEPVTVLTKLPDGKLRRYSLQIETRPAICGNGTAPAVTVSSPFIRNASATTGTSVDPPAGPQPGQNLTKIAADALGPKANVVYTVVYRYPGDAAAKRRAAEKAETAKWRKEEANRILQASTSPSAADPYSGNRNMRYMARGDAGLTPRWVWDNGNSTCFVFPNLQRVPSLYYVAPDGKESTASYSVHGDTIIATGTAHEWRLRDGETVMEVYSLDYNPVGATPNTGTISPLVSRVVKGAQQ